MVAVTRSRTHQSAPQSPSPSAKRVCPQQEGNYLRAKRLLPCDTGLQPFRRLKHARFPDGILALPHVLKQVDTLLMSPKDAVVEAARIGDVDWLWELLGRCNCATLDAMSVAAANGHLEAVHALYQAHYCGCPLKDDAWKAVKKAAIAATMEGYVDIVEYLLQRLVDRDPTSRRAEQIGKIFVEAAGNGQLGVVKFMVGYEKIKRYVAIYASQALPRAIIARQATVVDFLLEQHDFEWSLLDAFEEAVQDNQADTAQKIYEVYPLFPNGKLLVDLARQGRRSGVEYLYNNGRNDPIIVGDAFIAAVYADKRDVVRFLHATGIVSTDSFQTAFEGAMRVSNSNTALCLYSFKRASVPMLNQWFQSTRNVEVMRRLMEKERENISTASISTAFKRAARCACPDQANIVKFLYTQECISPELIGTAFVSAAGWGLDDVVELLRTDARLLLESVHEAFVAAVCRCQVQMVKKLYSQQSIAASVLVTALENVHNYGYGRMASTIIEFLSADNVPREYKLQAFLTASKQGKLDVLSLLTKSKEEDWPIDNLKAALSAARNEEVENFIRTMICEQLFSGRPQEVRASGGCGHLISTMKWVTEE